MKTMTPQTALLCLLGVIAFETCCAQAGSGAEQLATNAKSLRRWQDMRLGMFIHWGPVSLKGTEIGWSRGRQVPKAEYDQLYRRFNPNDFDADEWVRIAKEAGMKYLVITSKHHDGFCLWDSKLTEYDIMATPYGRDVLKELSTACKKHGIQFSTYYSICDWWHPDYPTDSPGGRTMKSEHNMKRYVAYMKGHLRELIASYGPLGILWFDGEWEKPWTHEHGLDLYAFVRSLQDAILINNRVDKGRRGMHGETVSKEFAGDYDTPEQRIGGFNRDRPWETCMTICQQWAWKPGDQMKSTKQCIQTLLHVVGGDGNLLFNVGPMPDGRIEPRQVERLKKMGDWLARYGEGVYGTRGGPFKPGTWGASTCMKNRIYLFVMEWSAGDALDLPPIEQKIVSARTLSPGKATVKQTNSAVHVSRPKNDGDDIATVIMLEVDGRAFDITPLDVKHLPTLQTRAAIEEKGSRLDASGEADRSGYG